MKEDLRRLRTLLNLHGIHRRQAASALYLSYSAFNRKLRGELPFTPWEWQQAQQLIKASASHRQQSPDNHP